MRGPPDARDIGSCRCVAQRRENGWGLIEEAPNHLPQCRRPSEIVAKLIEHVAVECGARRLFLDRRRGRSFGGGGGRPKAAFCGRPRTRSCGRAARSEEDTSELHSRSQTPCPLLL